MHLALGALVGNSMPKTVNFLWERLPVMTPDIVAELAPTGVLRAGINLSNFLLVTGRSPTGDPVGVSPDVAGEVARRLGVPVKYVPFKSPGELADQALNNVWDIGLIGAEPQRAETIAFSAAYCEIEATYLVPSGSPLKTIAEVDAAGVRIAVTGRSAYGLWMDRNIKQATLVRSDTLDSAYEQFVREKLEALAGLRPRLIQDVAKLPGARILEGRFTAVQQAIGTPRKNTAGAAFLADFVEEAKSSGLIASFIARHKAKGLSVAPPALSSGKATEDARSTPPA
jgi:polar amino acid transport system substrate-binding protein